MKFKNYSIEKVTKKCTFKGEPTDKYILYKVTGKGIKQPKMYVSLKDAKAFVTKFTSNVADAMLLAKLGRVEKKVKSAYFGTK